MKNFKAHILIVDDDDRIRDLVKEYLNQNNYLVSTAKDSNDAFEKTKVIKFDLIVLDIMMPGKTGLEFTQCNSYGVHYSNTLKIWREKFSKSWEHISKQGFDNTFKRMWNFYLSYCEAGFRSKNIDLIQFSLLKNK